MKTVTALKNYRKLEKPTKQTRKITWQPLYQWHTRANNGLGPPKFSKLGSGLAEPPFFGMNAQ
jgi:hypothetical protein